MTYGDFKDLTRRTASDKVLRDKVFDIAKSLKYDGYQRGLASMFYRFFDKRSALLADKYASGSCIRNENMSDQQLAGKLDLPNIKNSRKKITITFHRQYLGYQSC